MESKRLAAEKAVSFINDGMIVGLGTGSTSFWAIQRIGERVKEGLKIKAVASSKSTEDLARELRIPMAPFEDIQQIDLTIDGADEVDSGFNLIKGGGGALLREKILVYNSKKFLVIVDESKMVDQLGAYPLPVEIIPFASSLTMMHLQNLGCETKLRKNGESYKTDNGNLIVDCHFKKIPDPKMLERRIRTVPGVVESGIFQSNMVTSVIVGYGNGSVAVMNNLNKS